MKFFIINGPNLNFLGIREPDIYGSQSYSALCAYLKEKCSDSGIDCEIFQSNHEGRLVDIIQSALGSCDGIIINPAAYTHTSVAILDALKAVSLPAIEVHLSDVDKREKFRQISYAGLACIKCFKGRGFESYGDAILFLKNYIENK